MTSFFTPNENRVEEGVAIAVAVAAVDDFVAALGPNKLFISNLGFSDSLGKLLTSK